VLSSLAFAAALAATAPASATSPSPPPIRFTGETTDGKSLEVPDEARGRILVLVVGFTQNSAKATTQWSEALDAGLGQRVAVVAVAVLDKVPGLFRTFVKHAIDKDVGPPQPGHGSFVTTFDGRALRAGAPAGNADDPVIYVFRPDGSLASVARTPYSAGAVSELERSLPE
jgi:hypothetical protein